MARQAAINGETPARPMQKASLHNELVAGLREMIFSGELPGGGRVPERLLCERFAVSRTPLREALKVLASEGLLELLPNRGARVNKLTVEAVDEMFPVMGALEGLAGELACERITDDAIDEIRALHYQMASHQKRGELGEYFALNQRIHAKILEAAGNPTLSVIFTSLTARIRLARYRANLSKDRWSHAMAEHEDILNALAARDGRRLSAVLSDHLAKTCETVKEVIRADEAGRQRTAQFGGGDG